jgi:hypothetical protein
VFQKWVKALDRRQIETVILEMLNAPITSIIVAGLKLLKDTATGRNITDGFLDLILRDTLLNLDSNLYSDGTDSYNVMNDNDLFKDRIAVISHVVNLCKFLKIKSGQHFMVY